MLKMWSDFMIKESKVVVDSTIDFVFIYYMIILGTEGMVHVGHIRLVDNLVLVVAYGCDCCLSPVPVNILPF